MKTNANFLAFVLAVVLVAVFSGAGCEKKTAEEVTTTVASEQNWTNSVDRGTIPDAPISGTLNEKAVTIKAVQITKWDGSYSWTFSNIAPDSACGVIVDNDAVNFSSKVLQKGTFGKKMADEIEFANYHVYYHYEQADGTPMSINIGWDAKVVVKEIDETNNKVTGWASFNFEDGKTKIEGLFTADLCK